MRISTPHLLSPRCAKPEAHAACGIMLGQDASSECATRTAGLVYMLETNAASTAAARARSAAPPRP